MAPLTCQCLPDDSFPSPPPHLLPMLPHSTACSVGTFLSASHPPPGPRLRTKGRAPSLRRLNVGNRAPTSEPVLSKPVREMGPRQGGKVSGTEPWSLEKSSVWLGLLRTVRGHVCAFPRAPLTAEVKREECIFLHYLVLTSSSAVSRVSFKPEREGEREPPLLIKAFVFYWIY